MSNSSENAKWQNGAQRLSKEEINKKAWKAVFKSMAMTALVWGVIVIAISLIIAGIIYYPTATIIVLASFVAVAGSGSILYFAHQKEVRRLTGKDNIWKLNSDGVAPTNTSINAEYRSGEIRWNVAPEAVKDDFNLTLSNPITKYMIKQR